MSAAISGRWFRRSLILLIIGSVRLAHGANPQLSRLSPNDLFDTPEILLIRGAAFIILAVGLYKVVKDTIQKILK